MPLVPGTRVGPYSIAGLLGAGGMGEVYRARDSRLNRDVAIKILPASVAADAGRLARFQREAQVLASLSHPHIAAIYGLEESAGATALVMEVVEGPTLAERVAQGPIPLDEALGLARQIADALEAAHDRGIVHRDLKPANIKLTAGGDVKILDFGLAKAYDPETISGSTPADSPTLTLEGTRAGMILGTAGYMSPEQARGKPVDKRADIWAFGVVLMEMLTGKFIFEGETVSDTLAAVLRADIDWRRLPAGTPTKVRRLLQHCLERDPKRRLRDIGDAWIEIDTPDEPAPAPMAPKRSQWLPWIAAAVVGGAGIAWGLLHRPATPPRTPIHWSFTESGPSLLPAVSRDGSQMALNSVTGSNISLSLRRMDENVTKPIPGSSGMYYPEFSPDGQWIAAFQGSSPSDGALKKISVSGGTPVTLAPAESAEGITWGDLDTIVFAGGKGLSRVSSYGGAAETLVAPDKARGETDFCAPHFLPGSRALLFTIVSGPSNRVAILDMKTHRYRVLVENGKDGRYVTAGYLLFARGDVVFAAPFDIGSLAITGPEVPVIEGVGFSGVNGLVAEFSVSDNGLLIYREGTVQTGRTTMLGWVDRKGGTQPVSEAALWGTGRLSPDGRHVVNEIYTDSVGDGRPGDIWVFELERHTRTRLTFGGVNAYPIWTPDGRSITFYGDTEGKEGIYLVPADGSGKPALLLATASAAQPNSWAPDGRTLLYQQKPSGKPTSIMVLPVSNGVAGNPSLLHDVTYVESDAQVSPDGHWVAYTSLETGQREAYLQPFPGRGGKERISIDGADSVRWSRDGREVFCVRRVGEGALSSVSIQTTPQLHIAQPVLLAKISFGTTWDPAPDGKHLLVELVRSGPVSGTVLRGVSDWFEELRRLVPGKR